MSRPIKQIFEQGLYAKLAPSVLLEGLGEWTDFHSELHTFSQPTLILTSGNGADDFAIYTLTNPADKREIISIAEQWSNADIDTLEDALDVIDAQPNVQSVVIRPDSTGLYMVDDTIDLQAARIDTLADLLAYANTYAEYFSLIETPAPDSETLKCWIGEATLAGDTATLDILDTLFVNK